MRIDYSYLGKYALNNMNFKDKKGNKNVCADNLHEEIKKAAYEDAKNNKYLSKESEYLASTYTRLGAIKKKNMIMNSPRMLTGLKMNQYCFYDSYNNHIASWNNIYHEWAFIATDQESKADTRNYTIYREAWKEAKEAIDKGLISQDKMDVRV